MNPRRLAVSSSFGWLWLLILRAPAQSAGDSLEQLHEACRCSDFEAIQKIPPAAMDLKTTGSTGRTALHWAVEGMPRNAEDRLKIVTLLIERGADVNQKSGEGMPPLQYACRQGWDRRIIEMLLKHGANINDPGGFGRSVPPGPALSIASSRLDFELVQLLLLNRADPNVRGAPESGTAIHSLFSAGGSFDKEPKKSAALKILKALLDAGADPNARDFRGQTALHLTALNAYFEGAEELVSRNARLDITTNNKETVMHLAAHQPLPTIPRLMEYFNRRDAKLIAQPDARGNTPLHTAVTYANNKGVQTLLLLGAGTDIRNSAGLRPDELETFALDEPTQRMLEKYAPTRPSIPVRPPFRSSPKPTPLPNKA